LSINIQNLPPINTKKFPVPVRWSQFADVADAYSTFGGVWVDDIPGHFVQLRLMGTACDKVVTGDV
jgi:hypothetical protein